MRIETWSASLLVFFPLLISFYSLDVFIKAYYFSHFPPQTVTFEDKKRENFERGNLELEKRRQALQEQQRKEQERLAALEREEQERKVDCPAALLFPFALVI